MVSRFEESAQVGFSIVDDEPLELWIISLKGEKAGHPSKVIQPTSPPWIVTLVVSDNFMTISFCFLQRSLRVVRSKLAVVPPNSAKYKGGGM